MEKKVVLGIILGDHAGSSPEMVAKAVLANEETYIPVLTGNLERFCISCQHVAGADRLDIRPLDGRPLEGGANVVYFCDVPAGPDIHFSTVTKDSGRLQYDSMEKMMELERAGIVDGYSMAPITKAGFHAAGLDFSSEFEVFAKFYGVPKCASVIKCENIFRSTVVGHCAFREIVERLTPDGIVDTAHALLDTMAIFLGRENCRIAVAALNPHAGEDGLFGNEEATIIQPAIDRLLAEGNQVIGPCPADTVFLKARSGEVGGVVFLYHDQGNIAMKTRMFQTTACIYTNVPYPILSPGHGSALDIAELGVANPTNIAYVLTTLTDIIRIRRQLSTDAEQITQAE